MPLTNTSKHERIWLVALMLSLLFLAYQNRFVQDDAFISFRYARHLAEGHGLTWNINEPPVEGYTNFLWTILMAVPHWLNLPVIGFSYAAGLLCFLGTLTLTWHTARHVLNDNRLAMLALFLLGTNYSFSAYATGGLETQLQTMLFMAALAIIISLRQDSDWLAPERLLLFSTICGLALLTRLDSVVLIGPLAAMLVFKIIRQPVPSPLRFRSLVILGLPVILLIAPWLLWKLVYYGDILPNTYYAKLNETALRGTGFHYLALFLLSYLWIPIIPLIILSIRHVNQTMRWLLFPVGLWLLYLLRTGGDFMEFRMLVPVLPGVFIFMTWIFFRMVSNRYVRGVLVALVLAGSLRHALFFSKSELNLYLNPISDLRHEVSEHDSSWTTLGKTLGTYLSGDLTAIIAVMPAGAIPYYADLTTVDIWGLNDRWVARHGVWASDQPGHNRYAPWSYLLSRNIHLLIGQPLIVPVNTGLDAVLNIAGYETFHVSLEDATLLTPAARILEVPLGETRKAYLLYLNTHPSIEALVEAGTWIAHPLRD